MWTKEDLIKQAFSEIGLASYVFNMQPEDFDSALRSLDSMMATWNAKGIRIGYELPSSPSDSNLNDESGLPDTAHEAVYLNLAIRIAPSFGKTISIDTKIAAKQAYDAVLIEFATPPMQQSRSMPLGAGNRPWVYGRTYSIEAGPTLDAGPNDPILIQE